MRKKRLSTCNILSWLPAYSSLGMEITDQAIKIAHVESLNNREFRLKTWAVESLPRQCVVEGRIKDASRIVLALQSMIARLNPRTKKVHLIIPSEYVTVRLLKLPDIPAKHLKKLVDFEVKHSLHLPFENPYYDFIKLNGMRQQVHKRSPLSIAKKTNFPSATSIQRNNKKQGDLSLLEAAPAYEGGAMERLDYFGGDRMPVGTDPMLCDVMLVASSHDLIQEYASVVRTAGLQPLSIEIKALSLFRIIKFTQMIDERRTFVAIDINEDVTDISIFHNSQLKVAQSVRIHFDSSEAEARANGPVPFEHAELHRQFLDACNDLVNAIEHRMNFFRYSLNNRNQEFEYIVISGDAGCLQQIIEQLEARFTQKLVLMQTDRLVSDAESFARLLPSMAVPIGLALRGKER